VNARAWWLAAATTTIMACARKPPPRTCSIEAPPKEENAPLEIGMCTTDAPPDAGASDGSGPEATTDGG